MMKTPKLLLILTILAALFIIAGCGPIFIGPSASCDAGRQRCSGNFLWRQECQSVGGANDFVTVEDCSAISKACQLNSDGVTTTCSNGCVYQYMNMNQRGLLAGAKECNLTNAVQCTSTSQFITQDCAALGKVCSNGECVSEAGNCCKIKAGAETKACIASPKTDSECAAIAALSGSSYELAPSYSCSDFQNNPDCGTSESDNKIGCYLNDGSGVNKFYAQANPLDTPQPASLSCEYGGSKLFKCDQGQAVLQENCAPRWCISGECTNACNNRKCRYGQLINDCNNLCPCYTVVKDVTTVASGIGAYTYRGVSLYENKVVWQDFRNAQFIITGTDPNTGENIGYWDNIDVYTKDLSTGIETVVTTAIKDQMYPAIYGNKIVWQDLRDRFGGVFIYMKDLSTGIETRLNAAPNGIYEFPAIYGNNVVWLSQNYPSGIIKKDLTTGIETVAAPVGFGIQIYGNKLIWEENTDEGGHSDIHMKDLSTGIETTVVSAPNNQMNADIYGDIAVWQDQRVGNSQIYMKDLSTSIETQVSPSIYSQSEPKIYDTKIVWAEQDEYGKAQIQIYDLNTGIQKQVTDATVWAHTPDIYGNRVVWVDGTDLMVGTLC